MLREWSASQPYSSIKNYANSIELKFVNSSSIWPGSEFHTIHFYRNKSPESKFHKLRFHASPGVLRQKGQFSYGDHDPSYFLGASTVGVSRAQAPEKTEDIGGGPRLPRFRVTAARPTTVSTAKSGIGGRGKKEARIGGSGKEI